MFRIDLHNKHKCNQSINDEGKRERESEGGEIDESGEMERGRTEAWIET